MSEADKYLIEVGGMKREVGFGAGYWFSLIKRHLVHKIKFFKK